MAVYIFILMLIYLISMFDRHKFNITDKIFFVILSVISGLRYGVGTDYFGYTKYFDLISSGYPIQVEPGLVFLSKMLAKVNLNSQALFFILSSLTMLFVYKGLKYYSKSNYINKPVTYLLLIIFTYFPSFNGVRQFLAGAIIFYASRYIVEKKLLKFCIWIVFAMTFHYSSILFLGFYFLALRDYRRTSLISLLIFSTFVANFDLVNKFMEYILNNLSFLDFGGYIGNLLYSSYNTREVKYGIVFFVNVLVVILFILFKKRIIKDKKDLLTFNFFYLYVLIGILSMGAPMLTRLTYYFSIYMAVCIPKFGLMFDLKSRRITENSMTVLYSLLFLYILISGYLNPNTSDFIPYDFNLNFFN